jgi:DNA-binding MarR family transcriptional regulator
MSNVTDLILETFRVNGELLSAGDSLVADLQLTSARWQVLGAIAMSPAALPVAHIARNMGLSRQAVQRLVNELAAQELVQFAQNPHHQRAKLVMMTTRGKAVFDAAMSRQGPWADALASGIAAADIDTALRVLRTIRERLQVQNDLKPPETDHVEKHI